MWGKASGGGIQIQNTKYKKIQNIDRVREGGWRKWECRCFRAKSLQRWGGHLQFKSDHLSWMIFFFIPHIWTWLFKCTYMIYHHFTLNITIQYLSIIVLRLSVIIYVYTVYHHICMVIIIINISIKYSSIIILHLSINICNRLGDNLHQHQHSINQHLRFTYKDHHHMQYAWW